MAKGCANSGMFVSGNRRANGARANQYTPFDTTTADGRCESIGRSVIRAWSDIRSAHIFDRMTSGSESGLQIFLELETAAVRTDAYSHEYPLDVSLALIPLFARLKIKVIRV